MTPGRALFHATAVLLVALVVVPLVAALRAYRYEWAALHPPRRRELPRPSVPELASLESVEVPAGVGRLHGWFQPSRNGAQLLLLHGLGGDRLELVPHARALARRGYGVLLVDLPGHGESPGQLAAVRSALDAVKGAVAFLAGRAPDDRLGVYGFSFGGCLALEVAASEPKIGALALEGTPSDLRDQLAFEYRKWGPPARWGALFALRRGGFDLDAFRPLVAIPRVAPRAVLIIAGSADEAVPEFMAGRLQAAAAGPCEVWVVQGAGHGDAVLLEPAEYERRLAGFFDHHLLGPR